ncbi:hypothetical protein [Acidisoma sp. 7E03]
MRGYILELGGQAEPLKNRDDADEMAVAHLGWKNVRVLVLGAGLAEQQLEGRLTNGAEMGAALGRGKTHAWGFRIDSAPLQRQDLHSAKTGEKHYADRRQRDRALLVGLADRLPQCDDLSHQKTSFDPCLLISVEIWAPNKACTDPVRSSLSNCFN